MTEALKPLVPRLLYGVRFIAYVVLGAVLLSGAYLSWDWWTYRPPAHRAALEIGMTREVEVRGGWIGLPLDVTRDIECLTQSTFTLRRPDRDDPTPDGREDVFILGLANTTLTGLGTHHVMLWFRRPADLPGGGWWDVVNKAETDCGAPGNKSVSDPVTSVLGKVLLAEAKP